MSIVLSRRLSAKMRKAITKYGLIIPTYRDTVNAFKESEGFTLHGEVKAIYWDKSSYTLKLIVQDEGGATLRQRRPYLTAMWEDTLKINVGDRVCIDGIWYSIIDKLNVQQLDVVCDLVLEKVSQEESIND